MPNVPLLKKYNLMFCADYVETHTGSPKALIDLVANLERERFKPLLLIPQNGPLGEIFLSMGGQVTIKKNISLARNNIVSFLVNILQFIKILHSNNIDIVHFNSPGWRNSVLVAAKLLNIPVVLSLHNPYPENAITRNFNFNIAKKLIIVSESMRENFQNHQSILKKITCIHNGVDLFRFRNDTGNIRNSLPVSTEGFLIGFVGQICKRKGIDLFIRAASGVIAEYPTAQFVVVGEDGVGEKGFTDKMKHFASELGIFDSFLFLGKRNDIPEIMNSLDFLVVPSRAEPFGKVIIEAMACKKCVIATNVGGIPEIIHDGMNGLLVPKEDCLALQKAIITLIKDRSLRKKMGEEGYRTVTEKFSISVLVNKTQNLYLELLDNQ